AVELSGGNRGTMFSRTSMGVVDTNHNLPASSKFSCTIQRDSLQISSLRSVGLFFPRCDRSNHHNADNKAAMPRTIPTTAGRRRVLRGGSSNPDALVSSSDGAVLVSSFVSSSDSLGEGSISSSRLEPTSDVQAGATPVCAEGVGSKRTHP